MDNLIGEMAEWLKAPAWKACILLKVSRVRIPFSPPRFLKFEIIFMSIVKKNRPFFYDRIFIEPIRKISFS